MFDAKSILDALVRGGGQQQRQQDDLAGISDMLKQLAGADQSPRAAASRDVASPGPGRGGDDDHGARGARTAAAPGNATGGRTQPPAATRKAAAWTTCCATSWEARAEVSATSWASWASRPVAAAGSPTSSSRSSGRRRRG